VWTTRQGRLAVVFALLGGAGWWLSRSLVEEPAPRARDRAPNYVVSDFRAIETDPTGRPTRRLVAAQLRQFVPEDLSELDVPALTLFEPDGAPPWEIRAKRGLLLSGGDEVRLSDTVTVERAGTALSRSIRLATSELTLWPKRDYAQGDQPVRIESDRDWLTANGVRLWYARPARAEYPGRVHISIAPAQSAAVP
jgi:lipopolysaccharide export system protein LptC